MGRRFFRRACCCLGVLGLVLTSLPALAASEAAARPETLIRSYLGAEGDPAPGVRARALSALEAGKDWEQLVRAALVPKGPLPEASIDLPVPGVPARPGGSAKRGADGSQRVSIHLPAGYTRERQWPAVVGLHPAVHTEDAGAAFCSSRVLRAYRATAVLLCPTLRGRAWDAPGGAAQVGAVIDWAEREARVDPDAVILTGYSLGGHGVWYLAGVMPDRLAVAVPLAGAPRHPRWLQNSRYLRLLSVNAHADHIVSPEAAGQGAARLRELGDRATSILVHGNHFAVDAHVDALEPYLGEIQSQRRTPWLRRLEWSGEAPQRFYWLDVREVQGPARARARVEGSRIELHSQGVQRLALLLSPRLVPFETLQVVWNGTMLHDGPVRPQAATLLDQARRRPDVTALVSAVLELRAPHLERSARAR